MSDQAHIRVLSVDDHPMLREGIAAIINNQPDMQMVAQAATGAASFSCKLRRSASVYAISESSMKKNP